MDGLKRYFMAAVLLFISIISATAQQISGVVVDAKDKQPLIGATVQVQGTSKAVATDIDGKFTITGLENKRYSLVVKYMSYQTRTIDGVQAMASSQERPLTVEMKQDEQTLREVQVTGVAKRNTLSAMMQIARNSPVIVSNVSAQEISRTQDSNAGEVIRRVPGVSLIDGQFVMVRGLSQRYNNVWINGGAAPSSEADSRAFSFDLIPSSQIDNMQIVKTPSPEYPADYSGGFIIINTKDIPASNTADIMIGGNWNDVTSFSAFKYGKNSGTDFLGFDGGLRSLSGGIGASLNPMEGTNPLGTNLLNNGLNNDWRIRTMHPAGDLKLSASIGRRWNIGDNKMGMIAALNYTNEYRKYDDMQNNMFGVYDEVNDKSNPMHQYTDWQYNHNVRLGAMLNFTLLSPSGNNKYQFKNIFNQLGNDRYTWREGYTAQSYLQHSAEYYYRSRMTYNGQLTGRHAFPNDVIDWSASYSFANRNVPDRRRYALDNNNEDHEVEFSAANDMQREWTKLDEHIMSLSVNEEHKFDFGEWSPSLKVGAYGEYRTRDYKTRNFIYSLADNGDNLPDGFEKMNMEDLLSNSSYFGADKLYLLEQVDMRNNYKGHNTLGAGFVAATLPFGKFSVYAGVRYEYNKMELVTNTSLDKESPFSHFYKYNDLFPSLNTTYKFNDKHQVRLSYGKTVNRPEFREVSPSVFHDFDLDSDVKGNTDLTSCYIHNVDLRYEFYPSRGEVISVAGFYKYFDSPIEWTYTPTGGGTDVVYSFVNTKSAYSYGVELDIKKNLAFIGLPDFSWSFNGALIKSKVKFDKGSIFEDRPMQGQSPYLVNTGIFYNSTKANLDIAVMYNRIGKRIIGVGRNSGSSAGGSEMLKIPDSYEMPRDVIDLSASKRFGRHWEVKFNVRDLLAQRVYYKQMQDVKLADGTSKNVQEITRSFKPGRNFGVSAVYKF